MIRTLSVLLLSGATALACLNTSYSRKEEKQITSDLTRIIAGQFPEHGEAFYLHQVETHTATLAQDPTAVEARNDLAAALIKLKRYDEAETELLRIDFEQPNRYKTHANLGVLYKKTGEYAKAAEHTRKALEIRPEGHLGLGDYYLRMLAWRAREAAADPSIDGVNFLGIRYDGGPDATAESPLVNRDHLVTLIKADRHFPETYLILGDVLFSEGDLQNAARAYVRTMTLSRDTGSNGDAVREAGNRLGEIAYRWQKIATSDPDYIFDHGYQSQIEKEIDAAAHWLDEFQSVEASLLSAGIGEIDFAVVQKELANRIPAESKPQYLEAGVYKGTHRRPKNIGATIFTVVFLFTLLSLLIAIAIPVVRAIRRRKDPAPLHPA